LNTIIVGNGILGLSIAFRLVQRIGPDDKITIIGKSSRPGSATLPAGAMQNSFAEIEVGSLSSDVDLFRFELSHLATQMWPDFERELIDAAGNNLPQGCSNCEIYTGGCFDRGTYVINNNATDQLEDENFDAIVNALKDFNEQFDFVDPKDIPNYMPEQKFRASRAIYIHNEGWFNPRLMVEKLEAILKNHQQVEFIEAEASHVIGSSNSIEAISLQDGSVLTADHYVLSVGSMVSEILEKSNVDLNIQPVFHGMGASIELRSPEYPHEKCIRTPNRGWACGVYSVPYFYGPGTPNDRILIGATSFLMPKIHDAVRLGTVQNLMRAAMEQINRYFYKADLIRINVGSRPISQDTFPLLGKTSIDNFSIVSGTNRDGFHMAPVISNMIADQIHNIEIDKRFAWFSPERDPIRKFTREEAISLSVRHQVNTMYQHDYNPPKGTLSERIADLYREELEALHDKVGAYDWGIPPTMIDMYRYGHAR